MVSNEPSRKLRVEPIARWIATVATAVFCALSVLATPFGCAVGEFEEDRDCTTSALSWGSVAALVVTVVAARVTRRHSVHWIGLVGTLALAYAGALDS